MTCPSSRGGGWRQCYSVEPRSAGHGELGTAVCSGEPGDAKRQKRGNIATKFAFYPQIARNLRTDRPGLCRLAGRNCREIAAIRSVVAGCRRQ